MQSMVKEFFNEKPDKQEEIKYFTNPAALKLNETPQT